MIFSEYFSSARLGEFSLASKSFSCSRGSLDFLDFFGDATLGCARRPIRARGTPTRPPTQSPKTERPWPSNTPAAQPETLAKSTHVLPGNLLRTKLAHFFTIIKTFETLVSFPEFYCKVYQIRTSGQIRSFSTNFCDFPIINPAI